MFIRVREVRKAARESLIYGAFIAGVLCLCAGANWLFVMMANEELEAQYIFESSYYGDRIPMKSVRIDGLEMECSYARQFRIRDLFQRTIASGTQYIKSNAVMYTGSHYYRGEVSIAIVQDYPKRQYYHRSTWRDLNTPVLEERIAYSP